MKLRITILVCDLLKCVLIFFDPSKFISTHFFYISDLEENSDYAWMVKSFRRAAIHPNVLELSGSLNAKRSTWALSFQQNVGSNYG